LERKGQGGVGVGFANAAGRGLGTLSLPPGRGDFVIWRGTKRSAASHSNGRYSGIHGRAGEKPFAADAGRSLERLRGRLPPNVWPGHLRFFNKKHQTRPPAPYSGRAAKAIWVCGFTGNRRPLGHPGNPNREEVSLMGVAGPLGAGGPGQPPRTRPKTRAGAAETFI